MFPENVALPIGGSGHRYLVIEMHYNNPELDSGLVCVLSVYYQVV